MWALPALEAVEDVADMAAAVPAGLSIVAMFPNDKTGAVAVPNLKATGLESSHGVEKVDVAGHPLVADGVRTVGGIGSLGLPHNPL